MTVYIVDPSPELPVETYETVAAAWKSTREWLDRKKLPRLYALNPYSHSFREWIEQSWYDVDRTRLPIKVLAVEKT